MKKSTPAKKDVSRGRIIGFIMLGLAALVMVVVAVWPGRSGKDAPEPESQGPVGSQMREDALLTFASPTGEARVSIMVEIAGTESARVKGLMGRTAMGEHQGMLFLFPEEEMRSFWMANTPLPLDIIYVNAAKRIVTIQRDTVPYSEDSIPSTAPARYVVEVNAGFCARHAISEGDVVSWLEGGS